MELNYYTILIPKGNMQDFSKSWYVITIKKAKLNKLQKDDSRAFNDFTTLLTTYLKFEETKFKITQDLNKVENG